ncbi:hypothetical protein B0I35DRAFT_444555 [Stachybotrys elegans]|uniref:DUF7924 domain-containing protein n=1 Tax=Stachybotrys elegans TaxID=80388 RepID=A0A8K0WJY7_9HYPO|nr:hypothetical protein B0I35DRAFT_444555 [Stachybotrys elegans]
MAKDEAEVLANVMPAILGPPISTEPSGRNTAFGNLEPLTDGAITPAKPDIYYGSIPQRLSQTVRDKIGEYIVPSTMHSKPLAPNFFVEAKGPDGSSAVLHRQACYDGAVGSRGMHSLQNYGREQPQYDGRAYVFSSTYQHGILRMYAHHPTAPKTDGMSPRYHMTKVGTWVMNEERGDFVRGATALRNARDLAKQHRDNFIQAANSRASATSPHSTDEDDEDDESTDEFVDCEEPVPRSLYT